MEWLGFSLSEAQTQGLMSEMAGKLRGQIEDVLVSAAAQTLCEWAGHKSLFIDVEGHGRPLDGDLDVTQTIGWFTVLTPVPVSHAPGENPLALLKRTKEALRQAAEYERDYMLLRQRGQIPYSGGQVLFNYLGQLEVGGAGPNIADLGPLNARSHHLEISAVVLRGCLQVSLGFSATTQKRAVMERLLARYQACLAAMLGALQTSEAGATPSDFAQVQLSQEEVDLLAEYNHD